MGIERPMTVSGEVLVAAPAPQVWELVADPSRIPEFSPENLGAATPRPGPLEAGDEFVGHNRRGPVRWSTTVEVLESVPGERFTFRAKAWGSARWRVPVRIATWSYTFEEIDGGTRVVETWHDDRDWSDGRARRFDKLVTGGRTFAEFQEWNIRRSLDRLAGLFADTTTDANAGAEA